MSYSEGSVKRSITILSNMEKEALLIWYNQLPDVDKDEIDQKWADIMAIFNHITPQIPPPLYVDTRIELTTNHTQTDTKNENKHDVLKLYIVILMLFVLNCLTLRIILWLISA